MDGQTTVQKAEGGSFRVAIFAQIHPTDFSGGRYHSWMMAESLVLAGHDVCYVSNNRPIFCNDFLSFSSHKDIKLYLTPDFLSGLPEGDFDIVFLIPSMNPHPDFFINVIFFSIMRRARLVLLNFETPNWFNSLSPARRDPSMWDYWKCSSLYASMILSSAKESDTFARLYFDSCPPWTIFDYCYPSINSIVADSTGQVEKEERIILITRFASAEHKGGFDSTELICEAMRGYTLVIIVGSGAVSPEVIDAFFRKGNDHGVTVEWKYKLMDHEKFLEIKRSSLMLFPSFFEGFGLPPVEALYCNVPCICFDLPVLREVSGDGLIYVESGNWSQFRSKIEEVLNADRTYEHLRHCVNNTATVESYAERIDNIVNLVMQQPAPPWKPENKFSFVISILKNFFYSATKSYFKYYVSNVFRALQQLFRAAVLDPVDVLFLRLMIRPPLRAILMKLFPDMPGDNIKEETIRHFRKLISRK